MGADFASWAPCRAPFSSAVLKTCSITPPKDIVYIASSLIEVCLNNRKKLSNKSRQCTACQVELISVIVQELSTCNGSSMAALTGVSFLFFVGYVSCRCGDLCVHLRINGTSLSHFYFFMNKQIRIGCSCSQEFPAVSLGSHKPAGEVLR